MLRLLWVASRGYRFRPWRSPYLRWRIETYSGIPADSITARSFFRFMWAERGALWQHVRWVRQMRMLMKEKTLTFPEIALLVGTRVALGVGIGLLVAGKLDRDARKGAGWALVAVGALTTIPLAIGVLGRSPVSERA